MEDDPALQLLKKYNRDYKERRPRKSLRLHFELTLSILASIGALCGREAEGDVKAMLIDAVQRFNARFEACYQFKNTRSCVKARLEPMLEGARSPALILSLLR